MPLKKALAIALAAILTPLAASEAFAAPSASGAPTAAHAQDVGRAKARPEGRAHSSKPTSKVRPASPGKIATAKRKHDAPAKAEKDMRPDGHGAPVTAAIAMAKPMPMNDAAAKPDPKKVDARKAPPMKPAAKRSPLGARPRALPREARKSESKKSDAKKSGDKGGVPVAAALGTSSAPVVAAAIIEPLAPLPAAEKKGDERAPLSLGGKVGKRGKAPCLRAPIDLARGAEEDRFSLVKCDGTPAPLAIERVSILLRPGGVARPTADVAEIAKTTKTGAIAPGIARIDARLVERLGAVIEHFAKSDATATIHVVSGYRPTSTGSYHAVGRAMDFKIDGVKNEEVVAFCKSLDDTGCGYYPNSSFVHMDVREPATGHVAWIDASGPGETPNYVASWPPPAATPADDTKDENPSDAKAEPKKDSRAMIEDLLSTLEKELPKAPVDEHPADAKDVPVPKADLEKDLEP
jgi:hypothetical protein